MSRAGLAFSWAQALSVPSRHSAQDIGGGSNAEPAGGSGRPARLSPVIMGPSQRLLCLLGSWEEAELFLSPPAPPGTEQVLCGFSKPSKQHGYQQSPQREGWQGRPVAASQPAARDNASSSSICPLMSSIVGCPSCYLAAGWEPAEAPLTFSVLSKCAFTKG